MEKKRSKRGLLEAKREACIVLLFLKVWAIRSWSISTYLQTPGLLFYSVLPCRVLSRHTHRYLERDNSDWSNCSSRPHILATHILVLTTRRLDMAMTWTIFFDGVRILFNMLSAIGQFNSKSIVSDTDVVSSLGPQEIPCSVPRSDASFGPPHRTAMPKVESAALSVVFSFET